MAEEHFLNNNPRSEMAHIKHLAEDYSDGPAPFDFNDPLPEADIVKSRFRT